MTARVREYPESQEIIPNGGLNLARSPLQLADNEWTDCRDVEPMVEGVRTRNGYSKVNELIAGAAAQVSATGGTDVATHRVSGSGVIVAQSFQVVSPGDIDRIRLRLVQSRSNPSFGRVGMAIYADSSGSPGSVLVPTTDFTFFANNEISDSAAAWYDFAYQGASAFGLTTGVTYWLALVGFGTWTLSSGLVYVESSVGASTYGSGNMWTTSAGAVAGDDANFELYYQDTIEVFTGLFDYQKAGQAFQTQVLTGKQNVYKQSGGVISTVGSFATEHGKDILVGSANILNRMALTNELDISQVYADIGGVDAFFNEGIAPPTATPSAAAAAGGTLAVGQWEVDIYYWDDVLGRQSNTRFGDDLTLSAKVTLTSGNQTISITGLPSAVARTGDRATHVRINLKSPTGIRFQFAGTGEGQITLGTTTASITTDALAQDAEYDHDIPPIHKVKLATENLQVIGNLDGDPTAIAWSRYDGIDVDLESYPLRNTRPIESKGDEITALALVEPDLLIIGMKNSVWALQLANLQGPPIKIADGIGIASKNSWVTVGNQMMFWSDADLTKGPHLWNGSQVVPLGQLDKFLRDSEAGINLSRLSVASSAILAPGDNRYQWWTTLSTSGSSEHDLIAVYDYRLNAWTLYRIAANVIASIQNGAASSIFLGGTNGFEYEADSGTTDDGESISSYLSMKAFSFGSINIKKRMRGIIYTAESQASGSIGLAMDCDFGTTPPVQVVLPHTVDSGSILGGTTKYGDFVLGGSQELIGEERFQGLARVFTPQFNSSRFFLKGFRFLYQPTGRP